MSLAIAVPAGAVADSEGKLMGGDCDDHRRHGGGVVVAVVVVVG